MIATPLNSPMLGLWKREPVRFLVVGLMNTAFSYFVYAVLLHVGLPYPAANFGALTIGLLFSFRTQGRLVFRNTERRRLLRFATCWTGIYLLNVATIAALLVTGMNTYTAGALAMIPVTIVSYLIQRFIVFRAN